MANLLQPPLISATVTPQPLPQPVRQSNSHSQMHGSSLRISLNPARNAHWISKIAPYIIGPIQSDRLIAMMCGVVVCA